jgi:hypothetical protein
VNIFAPLQRRFRSPNQAQPQQSASVGPTRIGLAQFSPPPLFPPKDGPAKIRLATSRRRPPTAAERPHSAPTTPICAVPHTAFIQRSKDVVLRVGCESAPPERGREKRWGRESEAARRIEEEGREMGGGGCGCPAGDGSREMGSTSRDGPRGRPGAWGGVGSRIGWRKPSMDRPDADGRYRSSLTARATFSVVLQALLPSSCSTARRLSSSAPRPSTSRASSSAPSVRHQIQQRGYIVADD